MTIKEAEEAIAKILAELEVSRCALVKSMEVFDMDVTRIDDDRQQLQRSVRIEMFRVPGQKWG